MVCSSIHDSSAYRILLLEDKGCGTDITQSDAELILVSVRRLSRLGPDGNRCCPVDSLIDVRDWNSC